MELAIKAVVGVVLTKLKKVYISREPADATGQFDSFVGQILRPQSPFGNKT